MNQQVLRGVVRGSVIQLDADAGLPDGKEVEVVLRPIARHSRQPGEGLVRTEGALADDSEWDGIMQEIQQAR